MSSPNIKKIEEILKDLEPGTGISSRDKHVKNSDKNTITISSEELAEFLSKNYYSIDKIQETIFHLEEMVINLASLDFSQKILFDGNMNVFESLALGLNMLGEELLHSTVSVNYLENIYETMSDMLIVTDKDHKITKVNQATLETLKYEETELINKHIQIISGNHKSQAKTKPFHEITSEDSCKNTESVFLTKTGKKINVLFSSNSMYNAIGVLEGYVCFAQNINEIKKAQKKLSESKKIAERANQLKSVFLANMSHEIRTPLNGILGYTHMLAQSGISDEDKKQFSSIIRSSSNQLMNLINDILDLSKLETKQLKISNEFCSIDNIISDLVQLFKSRIGNNPDLEIVMDNKLDMEENFILSDPIRVRQIISNLISNAIKFTAKGQIKIGCKLNDKLELEFYVSDTGIGIAKNKQKLIFSRFGQIEDSLSRKYEGAGLGLSISKELVKLLGGKIWIKSELEQGSTFYFTMAYSPASPNIKQKIESKNNNFDWSGKSILIVEDHTVSMNLLKSYISPTNAKIITASKGKEAIKKCKSHKDIDLVLMDIGLPDINGHEATKTIKKDRKELIIIAQTAHAQIENKNESLEAGCDDFIPKPINPDALLKLIGKYL